jgi:SAM-dependent methyltransferase
VTVTHPASAPSSRHGTPFDGLAGGYDRMRAIPPSALERIADWVTEHTTATAETWFLEPGVGTGRIAAPFLARGYRYVGLDRSEAMVRVLQARPLGVGRRVVLGDVRTLPFADASFDVVLSTHLLYLVDGWARALGEIRRVLRPGGSYLHCFEHSDADPTARALADAWQSAISSRAAAASWPAFGTDTEIVAALRASGATVTSAVPARWTRRRTLDRYLHGYSTRIRPLYPDVEDELFAQIVGDFLAWARRTHPGATVGRRFAFQVHRARWPGDPS